MSTRPFCECIHVHYRERARTDDVRTRSGRPERRQERGSGRRDFIGMFSRTLGEGLGVAILGAVLGNQLTTRLAGNALDQDTT